LVICGIMGLFDRFKAKPNVIQPVVRDNSSKVSVSKKPDTSLEPFFDSMSIPPNIRSLLWIVDGKFKNYDPEADEMNVFQNELFTLKISFGTEPSLISTKIPIDPTRSVNSKESIGYYPSYAGLSPEQRYEYLKWLCDISKDVDIGYVFIFYYGLERHLISGNYQDAADVIFQLRNSHKNNSFLSYSADALITSALINKDRSLLEKSLLSIHDDTTCSNIVLLAKYCMKVGLTPKELMSLATASEFKNRRYIKEYPELFEKKVTDILSSEFSEPLFPAYKLETKYELTNSLSFANISFGSETRSNPVPSIVDNPDFKNAVNKILSQAHEEVKIELAELRKSGDVPESKSEKIKKAQGVEEEAICPYCNFELEVMPKQQKKCPKCGEKILVRSSPYENKKILIREDQVEEIKQQKEEYQLQKSLNRFIKGYKDNSEIFDMMRKHLRKSLREEPSDKTVVWNLLIQEEETEFSNSNMGLYCNSVLQRGDFQKYEGRTKDALLSYLEVCYIDLNGPDNTAMSKEYPELIKKYPPYNPNSKVNAILAPGVLEYILKLNKNLNYSKDELKALFIDHNSLVEDNRKLPLSVEDAWKKFEKEYFNDSE